MKGEFQPSKNFRDLCPDTVGRIYAEERGKYKSEKDAEKSARSRLHQIAGAFMTLDQARRAERLLEDWKAGDEGALEKALLLHSSTRERLEGARALYDRALAAAGNPQRVLDLACGLNPLLLGARGLSVRGVDISGRCVELVNAWARAREWDVEVRCADLLCGVPGEEAELALLMKLLPVIEQQKKGASMELMRALRAEYMLVTFPLRTLGGRKVGMEAHYAGWFEGLIGGEFEIVDRFAEAWELCYVTRRKA